MVFVFFEGKGSSTHVIGGVICEVVSFWDTFCEESGWSCTNTVKSREIHYLHQLPISGFSVKSPQEGLVLS